MAVSPIIQSRDATFWNAYKRWLFQHGYTIYDAEYSDERNLLVSSFNYYQASHPFAAFSRDVPRKREILRHQVQSGREGC